MRGVKFIVQKHEFTEEESRLVIFNPKVVKLLIESDKILTCLHFYLYLLVLHERENPIILNANKVCEELRIRPKMFYNFLSNLEMVGVIGWMKIHAGSKNRGYVAVYIKKYIDQKSVGMIEKGKNKVDVEDIVNARKCYQTVPRRDYSDSQQKPKTLRIVRNADDRNETKGDRSENKVGSRNVPKIKRRARKDS